MPCEFEQTENSNDGEELQHVSVLKVRGEVSQDQVDVEAEGGHEVYDVDRASDEVQNIWAGNKSVNVT